ncbi:MAG: sel1 repeat family protein, partial [Clostridiales bacterium]|nr:sel1 repeat family protein [Clostridiales bacterium]
MAQGDDSIEEVYKFQQATAAYESGNYEEAVRLFTEIAEGGDPYAQMNLGICYEQGHGVEQDYAEAAKWYRKAAEQGDADSQFNLGRCLVGG